MSHSEKDLIALANLLSSLDSSLAKGIGDWLQLTAMIAREKLAMNQVNDSDTVSGPNDDESQTERAHAAEFYSQSTRTAREIASFLGKSKSWVLSRIGDEFTATKDESGRWQIDTNSVTKSQR